MQKKHLLVVVVMLSILMISFKKSSLSEDNVPYKEVIIGDQVWMTKNLNVDKFRNGDTIPEAKTNEEWNEAGEKGEPAWCYFDNLALNGTYYGKLYNWYAVNDNRGLAPEGWKIPSDNDWNVLIDYLGGENEAGAKLITRLENSRRNEFEQTGFNGLKGGYRGLHGVFYGKSQTCGFWKSTEYNLAYAKSIGLSENKVYNVKIPKHQGAYIRCTKLD